MKRRKIRSRNEWKRIIQKKQQADCRLEHIDNNDPLMPDDLYKGLHYDFKLKEKQ